MLNLPELLEIQRINQALPFADPIALQIQLPSWEYAVFMDMRHWLVVDRARRALNRLAKLSRKHGLYEDDF